MDDLISEIKRLNKLLTLVLVKDLKNEDKFQQLHSLGFKPKEIAELCNTTNNTVSVTLNKIKKKKTRE